MKNLYIKVPGKYILESKFTTAYLKVWKDLGNWGFKISDGDRSIKPADAILADNSGIYLTEFKKISGDILDIGDFRPSQMSAGRKVSKLNGKSIAIVYSVEFNDYKIIPFKELIENKDNGKMRIKLNF